MLEGMLRPSFVSLRRKEGPPSIWDTHGISGNVFANPAASYSAPYPQEVNPWSSHISEQIHLSPAGRMRIKHQFMIRDASPDSQPKNPSSLVREDSSKNYGADQQRLQISDLHFDKFPNPATFACWKIRSKTEVCSCSQFPTEAVLWIKEVEMADSLDDLKSSCSIRGTQGPDFEVLASALNRIILNTQKKISLEELSPLKAGPFSFVAGRLLT